MFVTVLIYFVVALICSFFVAMIAVVVLYPFWSREPVFHVYDWWRYFMEEPYVIRNPSKNPSKSPYKSPYYKPDTIVTEAWSQSSRDAWYDFMQIQMSTDTSLWSMPFSVLDDTLTGQTSRLSLHYGAPVLGTPTVIKGGMVSRSVLARVRGLPAMSMHFLDWLCVGRGFASEAKQISYELLHTHTRRLYESGRSPAVSIFCKEGSSVSCNGIVALLQCRVTEMTTQNRTNDTTGEKTVLRLPAPFRLSEDNDSLDVIDAVYSRLYSSADYDLILLLDRAQLQKNLRNRYFFLSVVYGGSRSTKFTEFSVKSDIVAFYLGKRRFEVDDVTGGESIELMGSWYNRAVMSKAVFMLGFLASFRDWISVDKTASIIIPLLGDNADLEGAAIHEGEKAWYMHNMSALPVTASRAFVGI